MNYGPLFVLYPHEIEAAHAFAAQCGAKLLPSDKYPLCAQFVGDDEAFDLLGSFLHLPTDLIDETLRKVLNRQKAGTLL